MSLTAAACGSTEGSGHTIETEIDLMAERHEDCVEQAETLTDISICDDMLDRDAERIMRKIDE